jgi:hypothetical protein
LAFQAQALERAAEPISQRAVKVQVDRLLGNSATFKPLTFNRNQRTSSRKLTLAFWEMIETTEVAHDLGQHVAESAGLGGTAIYAVEKGRAVRYRGSSGGLAASQCGVTGGHIPYDLSFIFGSSRRSIPANVQKGPQFVGLRAFSVASVFAASGRNRKKSGAGKDQLGVMLAWQLFIGSMRRGIRLLRAWMSPPEMSLVETWIISDRFMTTVYS